MTTGKDFTGSDLAGGRLTIDLAALVANWRHLARLAGSAECGAVVKANAYGCGIERVVEALEHAGCKSFFVALPEEGLRARAIAPNARIFVLNGIFSDAVPHFLDANLIPILGSVPEVECWSDAAKIAQRPLPCALHFDSGMNRLGLLPRELQRLAADKATMDRFDLQLFMTHYACADDVGHPKTALQREVFVQHAELVPGVAQSTANSAAILQADGHGFDLARPGIALYGGEALNDAPNPMQPVVKLEGRIIQIKKAMKGESVGYGGAETLTRDSRLAYLSVGYADGYPRAASNMGVPMRAVSTAARAAHKGQILKGVGRVSMDMMAFDVTDVPETDIAPGDWLELFGPTIPVDDVARAAGTIGYELLTGLGNRYSREYVK